MRSIPDIMGLLPLRTLAFPVEIVHSLFFLRAFVHRWGGRDVGSVITSNTIEREQLFLVTGVGGCRYSLPHS